MQRFNTIRIAGNWLTEDASSTGVPMISTVSGLGRLVRSRQSSNNFAIDGTNYKQFSSNKGLPIPVTFPLIPAATFQTIVSAINAAEEAGTSISLYITGDTGTFDLSVDAGDIDLPATGIQAGLNTVTFNFVVAEQRRVITAKGTYTMTGNSVTFVYP